MPFDPFGLKAREKITANQLAIERERTEQGRIRARTRLARLFQQSAPRASISSLENELYPQGEKSANSLYRTSALYSGNNERLRRLSRMARFESPTASAMIDRLSEFVVGGGLKLRPQPLWDLIPGAPADTETRAAWVRNVEHRYRLWAKSYRPEYNTRRNLYQLSRALFEYLLTDGEYFCLFRYSATGYVNPLSLQIIPPENIQGGTTNTPGNTIVNGIEYDATGTAVAYHVLDEKSGTVSRISRFGPKSGRTMMLHNYLSINEKTRRGVPYLSNVIEEMAKEGQYERLEIQAAIVNALLAVWVKPPADMDGEAVISNGRPARAGEQTTAVPDTGYVKAEEYVHNANKLDFTSGGIVLDALPAGHEVQSFDTKRPNVNFGTFTHAIRKSVAAARGVPVSALDLDFNNSYSGARGELLALWMSIDRFRNNHGWDFEDDVYQMWFIGEVYRGNITAPGATNDRDTFLAYTNATWIGNQRPDIDPLKSVTAHVMEQKYGYKTGDEITAERTGGDYTENLIRVKQELAGVAEANAPMGAIEKMTEAVAAAILGAELQKESAEGNE